MTGVLTLLTIAFVWGVLVQIGAWIARKIQKGFAMNEEAKKLDAMEQVVDHAGDDWRVAAENVLRSMMGQEVTGEDIRLKCEAVGVEPHHSNAWGGFVAGMVKQRVLEKTGRYKAMRAPGSHARETKVYRVIGGENAYPAPGSPAPDNAYLRAKGG